MPAAPKPEPSPEPTPEPTPEEAARARSERASLARDLARHSGLGLQLALSIGLLAWFGWWLDARLETSPIGLVLGVFTGFAAGLISILKKVPAGAKKTDPSARARRTERRPPQ